MSVSGSFDPNAPIGVFDSGLGGLTVVHQMTRLMPNERILFVADQAHVPYGGRDLAEVRGFACGISDALLQAGCKAVVMACNISSATALEPVREDHPDTLVLGVIEPGARAALDKTGKGSIGVLATLGTVKSEAYTRTLQILDFDPDLFVREVPCPDFVPLVEANRIDTPEALAAAKTYLKPLLDAEVDTVILGCTHYPFLLPILHKVAPKIHFVDPAEQTVFELARELEARGLRSTRTGPEPLHLVTTGDAGRFAETLHRFLPHPADMLQISSAHWRAESLQLT